MLLCGSHLHNLECSKHFVDGEPTEGNPHPTLELGYHDFTKKVKLLVGSRRRQLNYSRSNSKELPEHSDRVAAVREQL